jgi:3-oxoacyl-[acyl-carrier-protein] synthase III
MDDLKTHEEVNSEPVSFYDRPQVHKESIPVAGGVPFAFERVTNPDLGIGGAYGTWGQGFDNQTLPDFVASRLGQPLDAANRMELASLGFVNRYHIPVLSDEEMKEVEVTAGAHLLREAAHASGWEPSEVEAVLVGMSSPVCEDYTQRIAREAGILENALKVSVHKACDSSVSALHLALNPALEISRQMGKNLAEELFGKKILVGGIEGLSRFLRGSSDLNALQLFGNGAGVIGVIPGKTIKFLVGKAQEVFDEKGVLAVRMDYPHSGKKVEGQSMIEVLKEESNHIRVAGLMHVPEEDDGRPVDMAGPMGMVKLFVRNGVQVVCDVYQAYRKLMEDLGTSQKSFVTTIVHHANFKINNLKSIQLQKEGIQLSMPWLLSEFGNVSAASNMIAFLRKLSELNPGDHILIDGFGAGTYYDVLAVALGE